MDSIFRGSLATPRGRRSAWLDSMLVDHGALRLVWTNWGEVAAGQLYRSNHPTPARLARAVRRHRLRSVINLRGATGNGSDALSRQAAGRLGLAFYDVPMSSGRAPSRELLLALIAALREAPRPALVHCKSGADRAGFAAAVFVLLEGGDVEHAMRQLSLRHGHLRRSRAGVLDALLLMYGAEAAEMDFPTWVRDRYNAQTLKSRYEAGRLSAFLQDRVLRRE
jgi:protein tyrosine/serine phosphatase